MKISTILITVRTVVILGLIAMSFYESGLWTGLTLLALAIASAVHTSHIRKHIIITTDLILSTLARTGMDVDDLRKEFDKIKNS